MSEKRIEDRFPKTIVLKDGTKVTVFLRKPQLRESGVLPKGGIAPASQRGKSRVNSASVASRSAWSGDQA